MLRPAGSDILEVITSISSRRVHERRLPPLTASWHRVSKSKIQHNYQRDDTHKKSYIGKYGRADLLLCSRKRNTFRVDCVTHLVVCQVQVSQLVQHLKAFVRNACSDSESAPFNTARMSTLPAHFCKTCLPSIYDVISFGLKGNISI